MSPLETDSMTLFLKLSALAAFVACALPAQDSGTRSSILIRARGRAQLSDGKPWANAIVRVARRSDPSIVPVIRPEVLEAKTDERGRFALSVPAGSYEAYVTEVLASGRYRYSPSVALTPGRSVVIKAGGERERQRIRIVGREHWQGHKIKFVCVTEGGPQLHLPFEVDEKGLATLPPSPGASCRIEGLLEDGSPMLVRRLQLGMLAKGEVHEIALSTRYPVLARVVANKGKRDPIAGVDIWQRVSYQPNGNRWMRCGRTDKDGYARLQVIQYQDANAGNMRQYVWLRAKGEGCALVQSGKNLTLAKKRDLESLVKRKKPDIQLNAWTKSYSVKGRVVIGDRPLGNLPVLLYASLGNPRGRSFYLNMQPFHAVTAADGSFAFDGLGPRFAYRVVAQLDVRTLEKLGSSRRKPISAVAVLASGAAEASVDLKAVDVAKLRRVEAQISRADGFPAVGAEVAYGEFGESYKLGKTTIAINCTFPVVTSAGRRGSCVLLIPVNRCWSHRFSARRCIRCAKTRRKARSRRDEDAAPRAATRPSDQW